MRPLVALILVACSDAEPAISIAGLSCDEKPGGPEMDAVIEAEPGYRKRLDELDLASLPATIDLSGEDPFNQAIISYMLDKPWQDTWDRDALLATDLGRAVLGAVVTGGDGPADLVMLRQGLHTFYACARGYPATLEGFVARFGDGRSDDVRERLVELFDEPDEGELDERGALGGEAELEDGPLAGAADDVAEGCGELREDHRAPPFRKRGSP